jgi:hypothetical protein
VKLEDLKKRFSRPRERMTATEQSPPPPPLRSETEANPLPCGTLTYGNAGRAEIAGRIDRYVNFEGDAAFGAHIRFDNTMRPPPPRRGQEAQLTLDNGRVAIFVVESVEMDPMRPGLYNYGRIILRQPRYISDGVDDTVQ